MFHVFCWEYCRLRAKYRRLPPTKHDQIGQYFPLSRVFWNVHYVKKKMHQQNKNNKKKNSVQKKNVRMNLKQRTPKSPQLSMKLYKITKTTQMRLRNTWSLMHMHIPRLWFVLSLKQ